MPRRGQGVTAFEDTPRLGVTGRFLPLYATVSALPPVVLSQRGELAEVGSGATADVYFFDGTIWRSINTVGTGAGGMLHMDYVIDALWAGAPGTTFLTSAGATIRLYNNIKSAVDHANTNRHAAGQDTTFFICGGDYSVATTIAFDPPNGGWYRFIGEGRGRVTVTGTMVSGTLFDGTGGTHTGVAHCAFTEMTLATSQPITLLKTVESGTSFQGGSFSIQGVIFRVQNASALGLVARGGGVAGGTYFEHSVVDCIFGDGGEGAPGADAGTGISNFIGGGRITNSYFNCAIGIMFRNDSNVSITSNHFSCSTADIRLGDLADTTLDLGDVRIVANEFFGSGRHIDFIGGVYGAIIKGNTFRLSATRTSIGESAGTHSHENVAIQGNTWRSDTAGGITATCIALSSRFLSGNVTGNVFHAGITTSISGTPGTNFQVYHNQRTSGGAAFADIGSPVGHLPAGGVAGHTIRDEGTPLTQRAFLNAIGYYFLARDDSGADLETEFIVGGETFDAIVDPAPGNKPNHFASPTAALAAGKRSIWCLPGTYGGWTGPGGSAYRVKGPGANLVHINSAVDLADQGAAEGLTFEFTTVTTSFRFIYGTSPPIFDCFFVNSTLTLVGFGVALNCDFQGSNVIMQDPSILANCTMHDYTGTAISMGANCFVSNVAFRSINGGPVINMTGPYGIVDGCAFTNCTGAGPGIQMSGACGVSGSTFNNCAFTPIHMGTTTFVTAPVVFGCRFIACGTAFVSSAVTNPAAVDAVVYDCVVVDPVTSAFGACFEMVGDRGLVANCKISVAGSTGPGILLGSFCVAANNSMKDVDNCYQINGANQVMIMGGFCYNAVKVITWFSAPLIIIDGLTVFTALTCFADYANVANAAARTRFANLNLSSVSTFAINQPVGESPWVDNLKQVEVDFGATPVDNAGFTITDPWAVATTHYTGKVAYERAGLLLTPSGVTVTPMGALGATTWAYRVTARDARGETLASAAVSVTNGNATLTGANFNRIAWSAVTGAVDYRVYRTTAGGIPNTTGIIATVAGVTVDDTGLAGGGEAVPTSNETGKDLDEVEMDQLEVLIGPGSGSFNIFARGMEGYVHDKFKINVYQTTR